MPSLSPGESSVQVSFDGTTYVSGPEFRVVDKVKLESITPSKGPIRGSNFVTLSGAGFEQSDDLACVFGFNKNRTQGQVVSSSRIVCAVPQQLEASSVSLSVSTHGISCVDVDMSYEFVSPALATSLEPSTGRLLGGTTVTVHGQGFVTTHGAVVTCLFGNMTTAAAVISVNKAVCVSPRGQLEPVRFCMISVEDDVNCGMEGLILSMLRTEE